MTKPGFAAEKQRLGHLRTLNSMLLASKMLQTIGAQPSRQTTGRMKQAVLAAGLVFLAALLVGCASIKQYSIESYEGPMPTHDLRYTGIDP